MKNIIACLCTFLLLSQSGKAQITNGTVSNQNFILARTFKQSGANTNDVSQVVTQVQYIDGLGRPVQNVTVGQSPAGTDIVQPMEYDGAGRQSKTFLPYIVSGSGGYQSNATTEVGTWYLSNSAGLQAATPTSLDLDRPYNETAFDPSPLSRPVSQRAPGTKSATASISYKINSGSEVILYEYSANANILQTITTTDFYLAGTLLRTETTDESGNVSIEFKDLEQQVVCKKVNVSGAELSTYYVYDDLGQLRAVLQPQYQEGSDAASVKAANFAFLYDYDERGRVITKKLPGVDAVNTVYDVFDRPSMFQDANQLARGVWGFTKYDALNRPVMTGEISSGNTRAQWQTTFNGATAHHEDTNASTVGYSFTTTQPTGIAEANLLTVTYYDNYSFPGNQAYGNVFSVAPNAAVKGQQTGSRTRMLNAGTWLVSTIRYDAEYRPIEVVRQLPDLGTITTERVSTIYKYDLAPVVAQEQTDHLSSPTGPIINSHWKVFQYDHADRLLSVTEKLKLGTLEKQATTVAHRYNILGQLQSKWIHSDDLLKFRRRTDYVNNIRGWITDGKTVYKQIEGSPEQPFFKYGLAYANGGNYTNGNISQMQWSGKDESSFTKGLSFTYDGANRLTESAGLSGYADIESGIKYYGNGNIKNLVRAGVAVDNLTYNYSGNRLTSITDASGNNSGVKSGTSSYGYDANGNMTSDGNRGATLTYNYLNLSKTVAVGGKTLTYDYDASGVKHKYVADTLTVKYEGGFEYNASNAFSRLGLTEGQAVLKSNAIAFEYYVKDHLGDVRVVFNEKGDILQKNDYYPFGMSISRDGALPQNARNGINRYLYNQKELQVGTGYLDYGARMYMPEIGRWGAVDNRAEKYNFSSPYVYCLNNPLLYTDPKGDTVRVYTETSVAGHAWLSTGEGKNMTVYSYGRYAGTYDEWPGINTIANGPGVLLRLKGKDGASFNQEKFDQTGGTIFQVLDVSDEAVQKIMDAQFDSSKEKPDKGKYKDNPNAHIVSDYKLLSNNCTTCVTDALNNSGSNATQQRPNKSGVQENVRFVIPASLQSFLNWQANSIFGNNSVRVQQVVKPKKEN